jgi:predicted AAA+ superfamily ATPase
LEDFLKALNESIHSWSKLGEEWEKIEADYSDKLSEGYPFHKNFREVISDIIDWKEKLKEK